MVRFAPHLPTSFILFALLHLVVSANDNCTTEGDLRQDPLDPEDSITDRLLQVCHIGQWRYVCSSPFNHNIDGKIVLQQLQCNGGDTGSRSKNGSGYQLNAGVSCSGVERRLIECPRYLRLRERESTVTQCAQKMTVECDKNASSTSQCQNGELKRNETNNILYICVSGTWRTMCSNLFETTQATVACRQLNQGRSPIRATTTSVQTTETTYHFMYYFHCTGKEEKLTECRVIQVSDRSLCNSNPLAVSCQIVPTPMEFILSPKSGFTVEADWTQPTPDTQQYIDVTISCTSSNELYTTTQHTHVNVSAARNETMHMMISGLMPNTSYNCCVSVNIEQGRSKEVCGNVTTEQNPSSSASVDLMSQGTMESTSSPLSWVGGIIIGAVLATVTLFIVWAAVWMIRRRQHSQHKMPNNNRDRIEIFASLTDETTGSSGVVNHAYYRPQPYEEAQIQEPEYSYADLASDANIYDTVLEQSKDTHSGDYAESSFGADNNTDVLQEVKNPVYEGGQETGVYS